jgi:hypothetical protein
MTTKLDNVSDAITGSLLVYNRRARGGSDPDGDGVRVSGPELWRGGHAAGRPGPGALHVLRTSPHGHRNRTHPRHQPPHHATEGGGGKMIHLVCHRNRPHPYPHLTTPQREEEVR